VKRTSRPTGARAGATLRAAGGESRRQENLMRAADKRAFGLSTGREAIGQSQRLQQLKEQNVGESEIDTLQEVEGRQFHWKDGAWQDATVQGQLTVVAVKFGSDAYFQ